MVYLLTSIKCCVSEGSFEAGGVYKEREQEKEAETHEE